MNHTHAASGCPQLRRRSFLLSFAATGLLLVGCGKSLNDSAPLAGAGAGGMPAELAGASAVGGRPSSHSGGASGAESEAGAPGQGGDAGNADVAGAAGTVAEAGAGGEAGASEQMTSCAPGGALFTPGNYANGASAELLLRTSATASTLVFNPAQSPPNGPPRLYAVERACKSGRALIVRDALSRYRVDFAQTNDAIILCLSPAVSSLAAALELPTADFSQPSSGCVGNAFSIYSKEAQ